MALNRKLGAAALLVVGLGLGYLGASSFGPRANANQAAGGAGGGSTPHYSVVETDITNMLVVDNQSNTLYFYTIEKDAEPGSDLHLRGSLNLNEVGKPVIKPKKAAK